MAEKKIIRVTGIEWDTEHYYVDLPTNVTIDADELNLYNDEISNDSPLSDEIVDYLSDKYGWLVKAFDYNVEEEEEDYDEDYIDDEDSWDLEVGFDPYMGEYTFDC